MFTRASCQRYAGTNTKRDGVYVQWICEIVGTASAQIYTSQRLMRFADACTIASSCTQSALQNSCRSFHFTFAKITKDSTLGSSRPVSMVSNLSIEYDKSLQVSCEVENQSTAIHIFAKRCAQG